MEDFVKQVERYEEWARKACDVEEEQMKVETQLGKARDNFASKAEERRTIAAKKSLERADAKAEASDPTSETSQWNQLDIMARKDMVMTQDEAQQYTDLCIGLGQPINAHTVTVYEYRDPDSVETELEDDSAKKYDTGKTWRPELVDPAFIKGFSRVLKYGGDKYAAGNWAKGMEWSRLIGALERHILEFKSGNELDEETGECHLYHAACMLAFLASHWERDLGTDDRAEVGLIFEGETKSERNGKV